MKLNNFDIMIWPNDHFRRVQNPVSLDRKLINSSNQSWRYFELTDPAFDVELYNDHDIYYDFDDYKFYCIPSGCMDRSSFTVGPSLRLMSVS